MARQNYSAEQIIMKLREIEILCSQGKTMEVITAYIEPGSPWKNGYCGSFNSRMRDEFLNRMRFDTILEAEILTKLWMQEYNTVRPPAPQMLTACIA